MRGDARSRVVGGTVQCACTLLDVAAHWWYPADDADPSRISVIRYVRGPDDDAWRRLGASDQMKSVAASITRLALRAARSSLQGRSPVAAPSDDYLRSVATDGPLR